jgi:phosphoglycolate phosphatase
MSPPPKALLFDWDNTLVDSWGTIHEALAFMFEAMGHRPWTMAETRANVRQSLRDSFPRLFGERWQEARQIYLDRFKAIHLQRLTPLAGSVDLLRTARERGLWLGVVSNKTGSILRREADQLGWTPLFGRVVGAADAPADKPDPVVIDYVLADSGLLPGADIWLVGDTGIDMECALNAGCVPVLVAPEPSDAEEFRRFPPAHTFNSLAALEQYLSRGL